MKKYGKYEKMPDGTRAKQPKVKNVLLQTYFTSLLCLVLCVTMFLGTSYAWFTSEVENAGNEIYIGTLKVGLDKKTGASDDAWSSLSEKNEQGVNTTKLFDGNIRWEPGYTSLETIRVTNLGDLAFKYNLKFVVNEQDTNSSNLADIAQNFEVWVFDHNANSVATASVPNPVPNPSNYAQITKENGWIPVGSLADVLNGTAVLEDKIMQTVRLSDVGADPNKATNPGTNDGVATTDTYTIALHMKQDATGEEWDEAELNLMLANALKAELESVGATVILNRQGDTSININDRLRDLMETAPDICVAIHQNSYSSPNVGGFDSMYFTPWSQLLAKNIYNYTKDSGVYTKTHLKWSVGYFMMRQTVCPTILTENGYMSNPGDLANMIGSTALQNKATAIAQGIADYFLAINK